MSDTFEHSFRWSTPGASKVVVTGTFDNWSQSSPLDKNGDGTFSKKVKIAYGQKVLYKYVVDGNWVCGPDQKTEDDGKGNVNNVLQAQEKPSSTSTVSGHTGIVPSASEPQTTSQSITSTISAVGASAVGAATAVFSSFTSGEKPATTSEPVGNPDIPTQSGESASSLKNLDKAFTTSSTADADGATAHSATAPSATKTAPSAPPAPSVPAEPATPGDTVENTLKHLGQALAVLPAAVAEAVQNSGAGASLSQKTSDAAATASQTAKDATAAAQQQLSGAAQQLSTTTGINAPAVLGGAPAEGSTAPQVDTKDEAVPQRNLNGAAAVVAAKENDLADKPQPQEAAAGAGAASSSVAPPAPEPVVPSTAAAPVTGTSTGPALAPLAVEGDEPRKIDGEDKPTAPAGILPVTEAAKAADSEQKPEPVAATNGTNGVSAAAAPAAPSSTESPKPSVEGKGTPPVTPSKKSNGSRFSTLRKSSRPPSESEHGREASASDGEDAAGAGGEYRRKRKPSIIQRIKAKLSPHKARKEPSSSST